MPAISPFLWFDDNAEQAMKFYVSIFKGGKVLSVSRMGTGKQAKVMGVSFRILGQTFHGLNGGSLFKFNEAVSMYVSCKTQKEVDYYWKKLTSGGGEESRCGWLKDKFGLSWQIIPDVLPKLLSHPDPAKAQRAMQAMLGMAKIDIEGLKRAAAGK
jgi:predicted 3-demethylubiquinone-9 3-methyltransferase (glyoxalase superfamily)